MAPICRSWVDIICSGKASALRSSAETGGLVVHRASPLPAGLMFTVRGDVGGEGPLLAPGEFGDEAPLNCCMLEKWYASAWYA